MSTQDAYTFFTQQGIDALGAQFLAEAADKGAGRSYLFVGPKDAQVKDHAKLFAAYMVSAENRERAQEILSSGHPDLVLIEPESAQGYMIEQIHTRIEDATLKPARAQVKAYIITDAARLSALAANALLKSLEEPQPQVIWILCAERTSDVIPTIVSRCTLVSNRVQDRDARIARVAQESGQPTALVTSLSATAPEYEELLAFATSTERLSLRREFIAQLENASAASAWTLVKFAKDHAKRMQELAGVSDTKDEETTREEQIEKEFLSSTAIKALEQAQKRETTRLARRIQLEYIDTARVVFEDSLRLANGARELLAPDAQTSAEHLAKTYTRTHIEQVLSSIEQAKRQISSNVTFQQALEALLLSIKEASDANYSSR